MIFGHFRSCKNFIRLVSGRGSCFAGMLGVACGGANLQVFEKYFYDDFSNEVENFLQEQILLRIFSGTQWVVKIKLGE